MMHCDTLTSIAAPKHVHPLFSGASSALSSLANRCLQATGSWGGLSFWISGHTCPPTCRRHHPDQKKGRGAGLSCRPDYE